MPFFDFIRVAIFYTDKSRVLCRRSRSVNSGIVKMKYKSIVTGAMFALAAALFSGCEKVLLSPAGEDLPAIPLSDVATLLAGLPLSGEQLGEVYDASSSSAANGYDEEYTMRDLFREPGAGVGDVAGTSTKAYGRPLRDLIREAVMATKATDGEAWLETLSSSDIQIYWPYSENWDGESMPIVTFDPGDDMPLNEAYDVHGNKILVTEEMAAERPVWVINRNQDAEYTTLEMMRREDPSWGSGGGDIVVTKAASETKTLVLKSFTAKRNFDSWFAGGSEFWVKIGAVEDFTASTEAELRLYDPQITDFMIVVRRKQVGEVLPFNAVLVSDWTDQLYSCALMIVEDDGGTQTSWKASCTVKYNSKSYGIDLEIPLRTRDDIVWRGSLSKDYIDRHSGETGHFGDVDLVFDFL